MAFCNRYFDNFKLIVQTDSRLSPVLAISGALAIKHSTMNTNVCSTSFMDICPIGDSLFDGRWYDTWPSADRAQRVPLFQNVLHQSSSSCYRDQKTSRTSPPSAVTNDHRVKKQWATFYVNFFYKFSINLFRLVDRRTRKFVKLCNFQRSLTHITIKKIF